MRRPWRNVSAQQRDPDLILICCKNNIIAESERHSGIRLVAIGGRRRIIFLPDLTCQATKWFIIVCLGRLMQVDNTCQKATEGRGRRYDG